MVFCYICRTNIIEKERVIIYWEKENKKKVIQSMHKDCWNELAKSTLKDEK